MSNPILPPDANEARRRKVIALVAGVAILAILAFAFISGEPKPGKEIDDEQDAGLWIGQEGGSGDGLADDWLNAPESIAPAESSGTPSAVAVAPPRVSAVVTGDDPAATPVAEALEDANSKLIASSVPKGTGTASNQSIAQPHNFPPPPNTPLQTPGDANVAMAQARTGDDTQARSDAGMGSKTSPDAGRPLGAVAVSDSLGGKEQSPTAGSTPGTADVARAGASPGVAQIPVKLPASLPTKSESPPAVEPTAAPGTTTVSTSSSAPNGSSRIEPIGKDHPAGSTPDDPQLPRKTRSSPAASTTTKEVAKSNGVPPFVRPRSKRAGLVAQTRTLVTEEEFAVRPNGSQSSGQAQAGSPKAPGDAPAAPVQAATPAQAATPTQAATPAPQAATGASSPAQAAAGAPVPQGAASTPPAAKRPARVRHSEATAFAEKTTEDLHARGSLPPSQRVRLPRRTETPNQKIWREDDTPASPDERRAFGLIVIDENPATTPEGIPLRTDIPPGTSPLEKTGPDKPLWKRPE